MNTDEEIIIVKSKRGKDKLKLKGFLYVYEAYSKDGLLKFWRCENFAKENKCKCRLHTTMDNQLVKIHKEHTCRTCKESGGGSGSGTNGSSDITMPTQHRSQDIDKVITTLTTTTTTNGDGGSGGGGTPLDYYGVQNNNDCDAAAAVTAADQSLFSIEPSMDIVIGPQDKSEMELINGVLEKEEEKEEKNQKDNSQQPSQQNVMTINMQPYAFSGTESGDKNQQLHGHTSTTEPLQTIPPAKHHRRINIQCITNGGRQFVCSSEEEIKRFSVLQKLGNENERLMMALSDKQKSAQSKAATTVVAAVCETRSQTDDDTPSKRGALSFTPINWLSFQFSQKSGNQTVQIFSGGMSEMHEGITTEKQGHKMQQQPQSIANLRMQKQPSHKRKIPPTTTPPHVNSSKNMKTNNHNSVENITTATAAVKHSKEKMLIKEGEKQHKMQDAKQNKGVVKSSTTATTTTIIAKPVMWYRTLVKTPSGNIRPQLRPLVQKPNVGTALQQFEKTWPDFTLHNSTDETTTTVQRQQQPKKTFPVFRL